MREHLTRVIDALLKATEVQELERARQQIAEQRKRYAANGSMRGTFSFGRKIVSWRGVETLPLTSTIGQARVATPTVIPP